LRADLNRILCADDEEDILAIVSMCLEMLPDAEVLCCKDGTEAMAQAKVFKPDLVLLDVMMPGMDGPATLRAMRSDPGLKDCPVILMTARVQKSEIEEYLAMGAVGVIPKPFDPMTLADEIVAIWRTRSQAA
jgi:two-component system, OmpR family, response regulator